jgi:hypothetical protein
LTSAVLVSRVSASSPACGTSISTSKRMHVDSINSSIPLMPQQEPSWSPRASDMSRATEGAGRRPARGSRRLRSLRRRSRPRSVDVTNEVAPVDGARTSTSGPEALGVGPVKDASTEVAQARAEGHPLTDNCV